MCGTDPVSPGEVRVMTQGPPVCACAGRGERSMRARPERARALYYIRPAKRADVGRAGVNSDMAGFSSRVCHTQSLLLPCRLFYLHYNTCLPACQVIIAGKQKYFWRPSQVDTPRPYNEACIFGAARDIRSVIRAARSTGRAANTLPDFFSSSDVSTATTSGSGSLAEMRAMSSADIVA